MNISEIQVSNVWPRPNYNKTPEEWAKGAEQFFVERKLEQNKKRNAKRRAKRKLAKERNKTMNVSETAAAGMADETLLDLLNNKQTFGLNINSAEIIRQELRLRKDQGRDLAEERTCGMKTYTMVHDCVGKGRSGSRGSRGNTPNTMIYRASVTNSKRGPVRMVTFRVGANLLKQARLNAGDQLHIGFNKKDGDGWMSLSTDGKGPHLSPTGTPEQHKARLGTPCTCTVGFTWREESDLPHADKTVPLESVVSGTEILFQFPKAE